MTQRQIGSLLALAMLAPAAALAGRIELPEWKTKQDAGTFQLGGGLWPESTLPATNEDLETESTKLPPLPVPLPEGMSKSKPEGIDEDSPKIVVIEDDEDPEPKTLKDFRVPEKIDVLTIEEAPEYPDIAGQLRDEYFALRPVEYLVDPQELLTEQKSNDVRRFLEYHAEEAEFDIYLLIFAEPQEIPEEISLAQRHVDWFEDEPAVTVAYFMEAPERTVIEFNETLRSRLPVAVFQRIFQSCIREAQVSQNPSDQVERLAIELSIRLYWMAKLLERESAGEAIESTHEELRKSWEKLAEETNSTASIGTAQPGFAGILQRLGDIPWAWVGSILGIFAAGLLTAFLVWRRLLARRPKNAMRVSAKCPRSTAPSKTATKLLGILDSFHDFEYY